MVELLHAPSGLLGALISSWRPFDRVPRRCARRGAPPRRLRQDGALKGFGWAG